MSGPLVFDRVREKTTTTGTGTLTLAGAVTGYQTFAAVGNGNSCFYCIAGRGTGEWEVGQGTYTSAGTTLSRTTVRASSNGGSAVSFSAGDKDVFLTVPADIAGLLAWFSDPNADRGLFWDDSAGSLAFFSTDLGLEFSGTTLRGKHSGARVFNSAALSVSSGSVTTLTFDSEAWDTDSYHSTGGTSSRLTAPATGYYLVRGAATFAANSTGQRILQIALNGASTIAIVSGDATAGAQNSSLQIFTLINLTAGDYVELQAFQNSGGNLNVNRAADYTPYFEIAFLGY